MAAGRYRRDPLGAFERGRRVAERGYAPDADHGSRRFGSGPALERGGHDVRGSGAGAAALVRSARISGTSEIFEVDWRKTPLFGRFLAFDVELFQEGRTGHRMRRTARNRPYSERRRLRPPGCGIRPIAMRLRILCELQGRRRKSQASRGVDGWPAIGLDATSPVRQRDDTNASIPMRRNTRQSANNRRPRKTYSPPADFVGRKPEPKRETLD